MGSLLSGLGTGLGSLGKGFLGGFGEGAGVTGLASKFSKGAGVTGGWADAGRVIGQMTASQQSSALTGTTMRTWEGIQRDPSFKNILMQLGTRGRFPIGKKKPTVPSSYTPLPPESEQY